MNTTFNSAKENIFFTSDTHFWHSNIIEYCSRPFKDVEEMNEVLIQKWNERIGKDDLVFHLGDFAFCGATKFKELLDRLNGRKVWILGNHDFVNLKEHYKNYFLEISQQLRIKIDEITIYLNHYPYLCFGGAWLGLDAHWQLFGHTHSSDRTKTGLDVQRLIHLFPTQLDIGVDGHDFYPYSFQEIKEIIERQQMSLGMSRR